MTVAESHGVRSGRASAGARRLAGCCLLDGGVRTSPIVAECGRSVLDLDLSADVRLLDHWLGLLGGLPWDVRTPVVRVLHGGTAPAPSARPSGSLGLEIVADSDSYRGPAGVVRDAMWDLEGDSEFLVCEAGRLVVGGLTGLVERHRRSGADVTIARDPGGEPSGVLVVAREMLDVVAERGFVDLKEQWLRRLVGSGRQVLVHEMERATRPLRTRLDLLQAARALGGARGVWADEREEERAEPWRASARLARRLEAGWSISGRASVSASAVVARSIVMEGAVIGDDAVVSSSVVMPGAMVAGGSLVMDRVVT